MNVKVLCVLLLASVVAAAPAPAEKEETDAAKPKEDWYCGTYCGGW